MSELLIPISRRQAMLFACFLVLYEFLTYIANDMIMPGMLQVVHSFNAPETTVATSLTLYMLGGASLQLILGPLSDSYGRRPLMLIGACSFFIFTLLIACSFSMTQFLTARFFQGTGLCFIGVIGYATIQELFDEMNAIRLISIMANATILAPLLGPLLGAIVIYYTSWRIIFLVIALFALLALWGLWRYMPEPVGHIRTSGQTVATTSFSMPLLFKNYKALCTNLPFCLGILAEAMINVPCIAWIALSPIILIAEAKLTVIQYGLWQLPIFASTILGNLFLRHLTWNYQLRQIIATGSVIMIIGIALIAILPYFYGNNYKLLLPGLIIYFFAISIINAPLNRFCLYVTPISKGTASAMISLSVMSIGAIGIEVASFFYQNRINFYFGLFCNLIGLFFLGLIILTFILERKKSLP